MNHLGDITKIDGHKVPLVDIVTGGSPCQDLSVAGKRAGLNGERSGLFMEQIRIIKEMRDESTKRLRSGGATFDIRHIQPRYMVWENVPGAFSSNKGEDFRCVLEETAKIVDERAVIPRPKNGKWTPSGCIMGDGWSIAWRLHDAQFWGVPQRRKRIALVADFGGQSAPEILFERKGLSGDIEKSREKGEGIATNTKRSIDKAIGVDAYNQTTTGEKTMSITGAATDPHHIPCVVYNGSNVTSPINASNPKIDDPCHTLTDDSRNYLVYCLQGNGIDRADTAGCNGKGWREDQSYTLNTIDRPAVLSVDEKKMGQTYIGEEVGNTLGARDYKQPQAVVYGLCSDGSNAMKSSNPHSGIYEAETTRTLDNNGGNPACNQGGMIVLEGNGSRPSHKGDGYVEGDTMYTLNSTEHHAVCVENHPADSRVQIKEDGIVQTLSGRMGTGGNNVPMVMEEPYNATTGSFMRSGNSGVAETLAARDYKDPQIVCQSVVRRLTPMECERLQGYPDHWTDIGEWTDSKGKNHKDADSPRYKALGNSIALPFWEWMAERMVGHLKADGVENPTMASLFDGIGGFPLVFSRCGCTPVWASEIEEFPIAVTKIRFPEDHNLEKNELAR